MLAAWLGWLGTAGTFAAYLLLWRGRLSIESRKYAALNVVGGCMAGLASVIYGAWPSAASNFVWAAVGLQSILQTARALSDGQPSPASPSSGSEYRVTTAALLRSRTAALATVRALRAKPVLAAPQAAVVDMPLESAAA